MCDCGRQFCGRAGDSGCLRACVDSSECLCTSLGAIAHALGVFLVYAHALKISSFSVYALASVSACVQALDMPDVLLTMHMCWCYGPTLGMV
ncbi:hypothetical protein FKM82_026836 [Ascaphus truei]